jgi:uncharacterized protein YacL|tara:strand:- start:261 stop:785 length:525 start_codon:yes stop_codon:yes gene_type:complete
MYDLSNFNKISDYLYILNGAYFSDLFIMFFIFYTKDKYGSWNILRDWYKKYQLGAVLADVTIVVLGFILTRFIILLLNIKSNIFIFFGIFLVLQIIHDILFYLFFMNVPKKTNAMLDFFKLYAKEASYKAIIGDSWMIFIAYVSALLFSKLSVNLNIILLTIMLYITPFFLNTN